MDEIAMLFIKTLIQAQENEKLEVKHEERDDQM